MNELFASIRADLTDRRLMPVVALVAACLVAAIAYAVLGGSSTPAPVAPKASVTLPKAGIAVTSTTTEHAVAETTDGFKEQSNGTTRNPFALLPSSASGPSSSPSSTASSAASSGASSSPSTETGGSTETTTETTTETKTETKTESKKQSKKPKTVYDVAIEFGTLPPGITPETAQLTPFTKLKLQTLLPSAQVPVLIFRGVTPKGKSATFSLAEAAILSGTGACLPSPTQCTAIDVKPGETEQLSVLAENGLTTIYELRVLSITAEKAKAKASKAGGWAESKAGRELLRQNGLISLPYLSYSSQPGVLVFAPHKASAARAHTALAGALG